MPNHHAQNPDSYVARFPIIGRHVLGRAQPIHSPTAAGRSVGPSLLTSSYRDRTSNDAQILTSSIHFSPIADSDCNMTTVLENHGGEFSSASTGAMADDDPVGGGADIPTVLERCCVAAMAALLPPRFVAWLSLLKLLRVAVLVEAERRVLPPLAIAASVFEGFVLFDGASFSTSPLLFLLPRPLFFDPISTVADSKSLAARQSPPAGSEMDGSGGEIGSSLTWERVGGMGAKLTGKRVGEIGDGSSG